MKKIILLIIFVLLLTSFTSAELKSSYGIVTKLTEAEMKDGPKLFSNSMYPQFGVACTNFTYSVVYQDEKGRNPEYVRINLNGKWYDMQYKLGEPKTGMNYVYHYIPTSTKPNFFYMEASNGAGKARAAIIDSPDQGPIIYTEKFDNNQIILLDKSGKEVWSYDTKTDQVEGVAISNDGNYIAAVTNVYIYLFSKSSNVPLWKYCSICKEPISGATNFAGIALSADGKYIAADMQSKLYFFERGSNAPLWEKNTESSANGIDMSDDGSFVAVGVANAGSKGDKIFLFDEKGNKIIEYKAQHPEYVQTGNFYQPDITPDGKYISVSTGCPDRRAYLFSGDGKLLFRSEQLTYDSPVHKSAVSDDGSLAAYSADHMQGKEVLFLFNKEGKKIWGFSSQEDSTARGVSMSADGNYIAIGTTAGHIYLFSKSSNKPLWKFTEAGQVGEVKLNKDGSLLAAGGTAKKVYLFSKESNKPLWAYNANTWVTKLDFNGEYIVAGTGLREYIGEGIQEEKSYECKEIINPPSMEQVTGSSGQATGKTGGFAGEAVCGDGMCEGPETKDNCYEDCCGEACENISEDGKTLDKGMANQDGRTIVTEEILAQEEQNSVDTEELPKGKQGFFSSIIGFFKGLFGK